MADLPACVPMYELYARCKWRGCWIPCELQVILSSHRVPRIKPGFSGDVASHLNCRNLAPQCANTPFFN